MTVPKSRRPDLRNQIRFFSIKALLIGQTIDVTNDRRFFGTCHRSSEVPDLVARVESKCGGGVDGDELAHDEPHSINAPCDFKTRKRSSGAAHMT